MSALMCCAGVFVSRADQSAIGQNNWWRGSGGVELGNGNCDVCTLDQEIDVAKTEDLAGCQFGLHNRLAIDVGAVGGAAVAHCNFAVAESNFAVLCRDGSVLDNEIVARRTAEAIDAQVEINHLVIEPWGCDQQISHLAPVTYVGQLLPKLILLCPSEINVCWGLGQLRSTGFFFRSTLFCPMLGRLVRVVAM